MQPQNKICTAYSPGTIRQPQEFSKKLKQRFLRVKGQSWRRRGSYCPHQMKPYKISNESPFFMLQNGMFNIIKRAKLGGLRGIE